MSLLIKNGRIITASDDCIGDIYIKGETVSAIGKDLNVEADQTIDATGMLVFPGGIDPHVHLDMPFMGTFTSDNYETATRAALFGGTTTVIDYVIQTQGKSLYSALEEWRGRSEGNTFGDYSFHIAITDYNEDVSRELVDIVEKEGITSFKTFMAYKGALMIDDGQMIALMKQMKDLGGLVQVHATNGDMIDHLVAKHRGEGKLAPLYHYLSQPEITEAEASRRFIDMAYHTGAPAYIVHMTCEGALNAVRNATLRNQKVFVETCPQYLLLDASLYEKDFDGAKWVMSPPLREKKDRETLWAGLNQGLVQVIGTDHAPFTLEQKKMGEKDFSKIPNGMPGIEHRLELIYSEGVVKGRISLNKFIEITSTNAAKILGLYPKKGCLSIGSDADIVIFDPEEKHTLSVDTHHMNCDYSAYEGWDVTGKCKTVLLRGKVAVDDGEVKIGKGSGQFIKRGATSLVI